MSHNETPQIKRKLTAIVALLAAALIAVTTAGCASARGTSAINERDRQNVAIAAGKEHSFAIDESGKLYATGLNEYGELGLGDRQVRHKFVGVPFSGDKRIIAISTGYVHSLALTSEGKVYSAGHNYAGELGLGDGKLRDTFTLVPDLSDKKIVAISAGGSDYSLAVDNNGKVYATGYNRYGQLGLGDKRDRDTFTRVLSLSDKKIVAIATGTWHSLALSADGKVYVAGENNDGQLGLGDNDDRNTFTLVSSLSDKKIVTISAGGKHSFALDSDGKVYATGDNEYGQLGLGDRKSRETFTLVPDLSDKKIVAIVAGEWHSLALSADGKVYAAGRNIEGQLGLGDYDDRKTWTLVSSTESKPITTISAYAYHSLALDGNGRLYATGWSGEGEFGLGDEKDRVVFTPVVLPAKN
ncbi:MAG: hypothetical protein LBO72_08290 [Helicobacteraceae bacterium]|jgi:alpha-tubulin suppressor-like RCC1 family protein|nr:hypothetical protein [Helicobacteraceae bacterium]